MNVTDFKETHWISFKLNGIKIIYRGDHKREWTLTGPIWFVGKFTLEWVEKFEIKYHSNGATISDGYWELKSLDLPLLQTPDRFNPIFYDAFVSLSLPKTRDNYWALSKEEQNSIWTWLLVANRFGLESWLAWKISASVKLD